MYFFLDFFDLLPTPRPFAFNRFFVVPLQLERTLEVNGADVEDAASDEDNSDPVLSLPAWEGRLVTGERSQERQASGVECGDGRMRPGSRGPRRSNIGVGGVRAARQSSSGYWNDTGNC